MLSIGDVLTRLLVALALGCLIGLERQRRRRVAGVRTNALVCLGASSFTIVSLMVPGELSPTRVAAQVVSGIGFLGAGVILREGLTVRGVTTAATLWCGAAVGVAAGCGFYGAALATASVVVLVNLGLGLRPLVRLVEPSRRSRPEGD